MAGKNNEIYKKDFKNIRTIWKALSDGSSRFSVNPPFSVFPPFAFAFRSVAFDGAFLESPSLSFFDGGAQEVVLGRSRDPSTTAKEVAANATASALLCGEWSGRAST